MIHAVILGTQCMHRIDKYGDIFRINMRMYSVPQIKYMAMALTIAFKNGSNFLSNNFGGGVQNTWVKITL